MPSLLFYQINAFACEQCQELETCNFVEDEYISIDVAVSRIREEVPSLVELVRERVDIMSNTRSKLDTLLARVNQEKVLFLVALCVMNSCCFLKLNQNRSLERIHIEFSQYEMALKKRMNIVLQRVEEEVISSGMHLYAFMAATNAIKSNT